MAESPRTPPFLLDHYYVRTKVIRTATASERPSVGPGRARDNEPARIPLWPPGQYEVPVNEEPRHQPTRPETRPNQRLDVPLGSPPSVADGLRVGAHRPSKPRAKADMPRLEPGGSGIKRKRISRYGCACSRVQDQKIPGRSASDGNEMTAAREPCNRGQHGRPAFTSAARASKLKSGPGVRGELLSAIGRKQHVAGQSHCDR
jgi:hypothetical protein